MSEGGTGYKINVEVNECRKAHNDNINLARMKMGVDPKQAEKWIYKSGMHRIRCALYGVF